MHFINFPHDFKLLFLINPLFKIVARHVKLLRKECSIRETLPTTGYLVSLIRSHKYGKVTNHLYYEKLVFKSLTLISYQGHQITYDKCCFSNRAFFGISCTDFEQSITEKN